MGQNAAFPRIFNVKRKTLKKTLCSVHSQTVQDIHGHRPCQVQFIHKVEEALPKCILGALSSRIASLENTKVEVFLEEHFSFFIAETFGLEVLGIEG